MIVRDPASPVGATLSDLARGFFLACLSTLLCVAVPVYNLTVAAALLGVSLGLGPPLVLAVRSRLHVRLLHILSADILSLVLMGAGAHVFMLERLDRSHDLRSVAVVLSAWLVIAGMFGISFHLVRTGWYRSAAQRSVVAGLLLLLLACSWLVIGSAFDGGSIARGLDALVAVTAAQLAAICFISGTLFVPLAILFQERSRRSA